MIRVLGAVAAAYVGYSLGNVVKHHTSGAAGGNNAAGVTSRRGVREGSQDVHAEHRARTRKDDSVLPAREIVGGLDRDEPGLVASEKREGSNGACAVSEKVEATLDGGVSKMVCQTDGGTEMNPQTPAVAEEQGMLHSGRGVVDSECKGNQPDLCREDGAAIAGVQSDVPVRQRDDSRQWEFAEEGNVAAILYSESFVKPYDAPELSDHAIGVISEQSYYLDVFQKEWTDLLSIERDKYVREVELVENRRNLEQVYLKTFDKEWIQRLETERELLRLHREAETENWTRAEQDRMQTISQLETDYVQLREQTAQEIREKGQAQAEAEAKISGLELVLATLEAKNQEQTELLAQSSRRMQEVIEEERAAREAKLKDVCLVLAKVEGENLRLRESEAESSRRVQAAIQQSEASVSAKLVALSDELQELKTDIARKERVIVELETKIKEAEKEKAALIAQVQEGAKELENQRLAWETELESKLAKARKLEQAKLWEQSRVELEEEKLAQQLACQKQLEEDRTKEVGKLQTQWTEKINAHKEEITAVLLEETKRRLVEEREKWRSAQETEWKKRLEKDREQQRLLQEEKDEMRRLTDDRIRKEGARLEIRLSSVGAREREVELAKEALVQQQRELEQQLREVEVLQTKVNYRDKLLKTVDNDYFDEPNFQRWISLRLGRRGGTVFWYSTGELFEFPSGDVLAHVEGLEVTRAVIVGPHKVHQVSRKVYLFRDKSSNEVLTEYRGARVVPVMYRYQKMAYTLEGGQLLTEASNGQGEPLVPLRGNVVSLRHLKNSTLLSFTSPVFVNLRTPNGNYQSYESYDYFMDKAEEDVSNHCTMVRVGSTPPFAENAVMHMTGWRLDSFDLLPESIRRYISAENPTWTEAPLN